MALAALAAKLLQALILQAYVLGRSVQHGCSRCRRRCVSFSYDVNSVLFCCVLQREIVVAGLFDFPLCYRQHVLSVQCQALATFDKHFALHRCTDRTAPHTTNEISVMSGRLAAANVGPKLK